MIALPLPRRQQSSATWRLRQMQVRVGHGAIMSRGGDGAEEALSTGPRELLISTEQDHTGVLVAVRGPGIDPSHLDRVFDAFYTTKSSGTGMGLSICRSIIDAHGGRLWAEANEARGTIFQFTLPAAQVGP
jgi:signal transduction histidine kinase